MKNCQCPNCGHQTELTAETVKRRWHARGYKFEYWVYYVTCPKCRKFKDIEWKDLPFKLKLHFLFKKG